ncbi:MAG: sulfurtransferase TusA family protein [bacterium]
MSDPAAPAFVVDARGLLCPLPVVKLGQAARSQPPGSVLLLLATDEQAEEDVRLWARGGGHAVLAVETEDEIIRITVKCTAAR